MKINRSLFFGALIVVFVVSLLGALWEFSPRRQVGRAFDRLISSAEARKWDKMRALMAENYHDSWGLNRDQALEGAKEVLQHFLLLEITPENERISIQGDQAEIVVRLRIAGKGSPIAGEVMQRVNSFQNDFQFAWKPESWVPWSWQLTSVRQSDISFDSSWIP